MRVLIVDDNENIIEAIRDYFDSENIECTAVTDGASGWRKYKENYDAVLLDIAIPKLNGLDIINQLDNKTISERNIIVITTRFFRKTQDQKAGVRSPIQTNIAGKNR
ncbi:MAG: response regulator [Candidatus Nitrosocosmicus sp.]